MSSIAETNTSPITFAKSVSTLLADRKYGEIVHILCLKGVLSFLFQETLYNVGPNDYVILPNVRLARSFNESSDFEGIVMALDERFVTGLALRSNYGVIGQLALLQNPVMKLSSEIALRCAEDLRRLNERLHDRGHYFYEEMIGHLLMAHILDLYDIHAKSARMERLSDRKADLLNRFIGLLMRGDYREYRQLDYYAKALFVNGHYLSEVCRKASGRGASYFIERFVLQDIVRQLYNKKCPINRIVERLHFSSASYLTRYFSERIGMTPSEFRKRLP